MHRLLERQLKRFLPLDISAGGPLAAFLDAVDQAYQNFDEDRVLLERSNGLSSQELVEANREMHEVLKQLERSMSLVRATLDSTTDGILVVGVDGKISDFNHKFVEMWKLPDTLVRAKNDEAVIMYVLEQLKDPGGFLSKVKELYSNPEATSFDVLEFTDGRIFERYSQAQFFKEEIIGRVWSFRDVTERRRLENMFLQSEKMSAVGQLAGGVAHEINNPLGVILGFAQSMKSRVPAESPLLLPLDHIEREAKRCKTLVQNLLTFSRVSSSDEQNSVDVNAAIEDALSFIVAQSKFNSIELKRDFFAGLPSVEANRNQLQQIIINLSNNAIDAMGASGTLTLRTFPDHSGGNEWVAVEISDTGKGIPPEIRGKIFEPFFTTKEVGKGTGLGLSLVYELVQKHKGQIDFTSEMGCGTTFKVLLPSKSESN